MKIWSKYTPKQTKLHHLKKIKTFSKCIPGLPRYWKFYFDNYKYSQMPTGLFSRNLFNHFPFRFFEKIYDFHLVMYDCIFSVQNNHSCQKFIIAIIFTFFWQIYTNFNWIWCISLYSMQCKIGIVLSQLQSQTVYIQLCQIFTNKQSQRSSRDSEK